MKYYEKHQTAFDYAIAIGAFVTFLVFTQVIWSRGHFMASLSGTRQPLYAALAGVGGAMLGFILAAAAIILTAVDTPRFRQVRGSSQYPKIFTVWFEAIYVLAITTIWSFVGLVADSNASPKPLITYIMVALVFLSSSRVYRTVWLLKKISLIAAQPIPAPPPEAMAANAS